MSEPPADPQSSPQALLVGTDGWLESLAEDVRTGFDASVTTVGAASTALDAVRDRRIDCVVAQLELEDGTGVEFVEDVRATSRSLPVVLATPSGSEAVASDAIAAGVTEYVPVDDPANPPVEELRRVIERALEDAEEDARRADDRSPDDCREQARQFEATFHDEHTATWVLDSEGRLVRANRVAREAIESDVDAVAGRPFWTLPWWTTSGEPHPDVRALVRDAIDGTFGNAVITQTDRSDAAPVVELSVRPVEDERGAVESIVVEGVEITERVDLERTLRQSERLHRVTLNEMTDTVLITDEDGEYTYVCPNVNFIFGYTAEEIRELGTIDDLLGEDLFDREELAAEGVLKNIECTVTDQAGRPHTLLVNVREVSIMGGTLLYSCRDVTKRKQREAALATLQETARDFLYAGTQGEIARHVVDDTPGVLDFEASAVYLFDAEHNELRPAASSSAMEALDGPLPAVPADGETLPSYSFVADEPLFLDDVHDADRLANPATDLRSAAYVPLGDHGVYVAGSDRVAAFDDASRELADLLAATAEAAFDRVSRESQLREQERTLQRQNEQLSALNATNETIRAIDQALVRAETRAEVDRAVCELLTADDRFSFAWIGAVEPTSDEVVPRAWAGAEQGYLDGQSFAVDDGAEPAVRTASSGTVTAVPDVAAGLREEEWRSAALSRDFLSVLGVPLAYDDVTYGVLTVYAETQDAFDETARSVLAELGETVASALSSLERKNALLTTSTTRIEFDVDDPTFVLSRLATDAECTLSYQGGVQQTEAGSYVFVTVEDAPVEAVERAAADLVAVDDVRRIGATDAGGVLRLRLSQPFLALELADHGALLRSAVADPASTTLTVDVPDGIDVRTVTQLVREALDGVELHSKRSFDRSADGRPHSAFLDELTDRQLEVLQTAYYSGYFESPRESTGEDVAATLDVSPAAFYQHVRTVERTLFSTLFDGSAVPAAVDSGVE